MQGPSLQRPQKEIGGQGPFWTRLIKGQFLQKTKCYTTIESASAAIITGSTIWDWVICKDQS